MNGAEPAPQSRAEALARGMGYWIDPKPSVVRTLAMVESELADAKTDLADRERKVAAIINGYAPPIASAMRQVRPGCARGCLDCALACSLYVGWLPRARADVARLEAERSAMLGATGSNIHPIKAAADRRFAIFGAR